MISIRIHKDKRGSWLMRVMDAGDNHERCILHGSATTPREEVLAEEAKNSSMESSLAAASAGAS